MVSKIVNSSFGLSFLLFYIYEQTHFVLYLSYFSHLASGFITYLAMHSQILLCLFIYLSYDKSGLETYLFNHSISFGFWMLIFSFSFYYYLSICIQNISMSQTNGTVRISNFIFDFNQVLGKGATGYVYKGFNVETYEAVAVKAIQMSQVNNEVTQYLLDGEKKAMLTIKNPFVVKTFDIVQEQDYCYIVMEYCPNGTLKEYIQQKGKLSSEESVNLFKKIVAGYIAVVDSLFIHRDLKTANILLRNNGQPVIIDFGYCEMIMGKRPMIQYNVGSPSYMSPEAYTRSRYSEKSDIWSLGIILYEMLTGKTADYGISNIKDYFKMIESQGKIRISTENMTPLCKQLLTAALEVEQDKRATIHKLKYVIDKSCIPKMHVQFQKQVSETPTSKNSSNQLKFIPQPQFNYGSVKSIPTAPDKKQKIAEHIRMLRNSSQIVTTSEKVISSSVQHNVSANFNSVPEKNQQSIILMSQPAQNIPPYHSVLRKSLERNTPERMMKKILSSKQVEGKSFFKRMPILQKATTLPGSSVIATSRQGITSLRVI